MRIYFRPLFALLFIAFQQILLAQVLFGPKIGLNQNTATVDSRNISHTKDEKLYSYHLGFVLDYAFTKNLAIRTELLYSQKGYKVRKYFNALLMQDENDQNSSTWQLQMNYIELPLLLKLSSENKRYKFFATGGGYVAYWASGTRKGSFYTSDLGGEFYERKNAEEKYEFDSDFGINRRRDNRIDYGLAIGGGFAYKIQRGEFFIEARYLHGLANRFDYEGERPKIEMPQLNRNWNFSVGFLLKLKEAKPKKLRKNTEESETDEENEESSE